MGGLYWRRASSTGAVLALIAGFFALTGLTPIREPLSDALSPLTAATGIAVTEATLGLGSVVLALVAMVVGSLLWPDDKQAVTAAEVP